MFARLSNILSPLKNATFAPLNKIFTSINFPTAARRSALLALPAFMLYNQYIYATPQKDEETK